MGVAIIWEIQSDKKSTLHDEQAIHWTIEQKIKLKPEYRASSKQIPATYL